MFCDLGLPTFSIIVYSAQFNLGSRVDINSSYACQAYVFLTKQCIIWF